MRAVELHDRLNNRSGATAYRWKWIVLTQLLSKKLSYFLTENVCFRTCVILAKVSLLDFMKRNQSFDYIGETCYQPHTYYNMCLGSKVCLISFVTVLHAKTTTYINSLKAKLSIKIETRSKFYIYQFINILCIFMQPNTNYCLISGK